jgi:hypothetical protein
MKEIPSLINLLYECINEVEFNLSNAADIIGDTFKIGHIKYRYHIQKLNIDGKEIPDIAFNQVGNNTPNIPINNTEKGEIFKVYSTMYKIIHDYIQSEKPELFSISALESSGYHPIYHRLVKDNPISGYFTVNSSLKVKNSKGQTLIVILLKKINNKK